MARLPARRPQFAGANRPLPVPATDPFFARVSLLLHMNGADAGTVFTDSSSHAFATAAVGPTTSTANQKWAPSSARYLGAGNKLLLVDHHAELDLSTPVSGVAPDWTLEAWVFLASLSATWRTILVKDSIFAGGIDSGSYQLDIDASDRLRLIVGGSGAPNQILTHGAALGAVDGLWHHVAATRAGNTLRIFWDGVLKNSAAVSSVMTDNARELIIGRHLTSNVDLHAWDGYIDDLRVTKGVARYTAADFAPPTAAFPDS